MQKFSQWLEAKLEKAQKTDQDENTPSGVRKLSGDLKDYPGHLKRIGTVEPFKIKKV